MTCHNCGRTALYRVGDKGFCKLHRQDAVNIRKSVVRKYSEAVDQKELDFRERRRIIKQSLYRPTPEPLRAATRLKDVKREGPEGV